MLMPLLEKVGTVFDPKNVKDLGWVPSDWTHKFIPDYVRDITGMARNMPPSKHLTNWS